MNCVMGGARRKFYLTHLCCDASKKNLTTVRLVDVLRPMPILLTNIVSLFACSLPPSVSIYLLSLDFCIDYKLLGEGLCFSSAFIKYQAQWSPSPWLRLLNAMVIQVVIVVYL